MVAHNAILYRDLPILRAPARRTWSSRVSGAYSRDGASTSAGPYSALMAGTISLLAEDILEAYLFEDHRCLVDVAGGEGAFLEAVADRAPGLDLTALRAAAGGAPGARLDLPAPVSTRGSPSSKVTSSPIQSRPERIRHPRSGHPRSRRRCGARDLTRAVRRSLRRNGVVLVAEPMAGTAGAEPMGDAYFGFYLLAMGHGRPRPSRSSRAFSAPPVSTASSPCPPDAPC